MPYCTKQDLFDRFGMEELLLLTDRENVGGVDDTVLDRALADATTKINSSVSVRYPLPLAPEVAASLVQTACDLTRYYLFTGQPTDNVKKHYDDAIAFLRGVAAGSERLVGQSGPTVETAGVAELDNGRSQVFKGGGF